MPMYEYECRECGSRFEKLVFNDGEAVTCKECKSPRVEMRLSVFAVGGERGHSASREEGPCASCGAAERGWCNRN